MSHIVQIKSQVTDENAVRAACQRLNWEQPIFGDFRVFSVTRTGLGVKAPGWQFPIVCDLNTGAVDYDNYNGNWGDQARLDEFMQAYSIEKAKIQAGLSGYQSYEEMLADGSVKLTVVVEG
jgi:hypothetical protein